MIAPIGIYSNKYTTLKELPNNATIGIPNDISNKARCLLILQEAGLIKLNPNVGLKGDVTDIIENNNNLSFKEFKANKLTQQRVNLDAVFINETYAIESSLDSSKDSIYREKPNSPYVNIVAVKKGRENDEAIQILVKTMKTEKVKKYIEKKYKGAVIPAV